MNPNDHLDAGRLGWADRHLRRSLGWGAVAIVLASAGTLAAASGRIEREQSTYSGPQARQCIPARLNVSAVLAGTGIAVSPLPGSHDASPRTQISLLGPPASELADVTVTGKRTGRHSGRLHPYSQGDGASFVSYRPFRPGERVTVKGRLLTPTGQRAFSYRFRISYPDPVRYVPWPAAAPANPGELQSFQSAPTLSPPAVDVTQTSPQDPRGEIMATPYNGVGQSGPMIFSPDGQLVWMDPLPHNVFAANLQVQRMDGRPVLTWWQGYIPPQGFGLGEEIVANSSYEPIMRVRAGNGYLADLHDFRLEPDNTAVLTVFSTIHCDLSSDGGPRDAAVTDTIFQELDLKTGLVRREWHSLDHVPITASYASPEQSSAQWPFDYIHVNTVDPLPNGTTLLSARNTSALYVLDTRTGQIIATVGGKQSTVTMGPGAATAYQHDAVALPHGEVSVFDNGGKPFVHSQSRGLVLRLNLHNSTDTEVTELTHPTPIQSASQGDVQRVGGGDWFVGWGGEPYFSIFDTSGRLIYDAHMPSPTQSYRAYLFAWHATPAYPPAIAVQPTATGTSVYASWNGATQVASWRVLAGGSPGRLAPVARTPRTGFQTTAAVRRARFYAVQALNASGTVLGRSPVLAR